MKGTISERADDLPLIIHWLKEMDIASIIDGELPPPHGNRKGLSYGQLSVLFLGYVVSQSDHRLCAVEPWVEKHHQTLEMSTDKARSDTTSFSVYHQPETETEEGENLLNFGYSKDRRPGLVQYRQMLATLDPVGLPLLGVTLPGNKTDESDYLPT